MDISIVFGDVELGASIYHTGKPGIVELHVQVREDRLGNVATLLGGILATIELGLNEEQTYKFSAEFMAGILDIHIAKKEMMEAINELEGNGSSDPPKIH